MCLACADKLMAVDVAVARLDAQDITPITKDLVMLMSLLPILMLHLFSSLSHCRCYCQTVIAVAVPLIGYVTA